MREEQITVLLKRNADDKCAICNNDLPIDPSLIVSEELVQGVTESAVKICASHVKVK